METFDTPRILLINTGGTIDADPYEVTPERVVFTLPSILHEAVEKAGFKERCDIVHLCRKDSKDLTKNDLQEIVDTMKEKKDYDFIIVTMGTDKIMPYATDIKEILQRAGITDKTVSFVGAMQPLRHGEVSDGWKNLERALNIRHVNACLNVVTKEKNYPPSHSWKKDYGNRNLLTFYVDETSSFHTR